MLEDGEFKGKHGELILETEFTATQSRKHIGGYGWFNENGYREYPGWIWEHQPPNNINKCMFSWS